MSQKTMLRKRTDTR